MVLAVPAVLGVYQPRRPQASPLFRLVQDHLRGLQTVYDERFAREYGPWRPVMGDVAEKFLACGVLAHGFARIRCDDCAHEYLLAFSCKCRSFCPSCHAKRLRAYCLYRRRLLGEIARVAAGTVTAAICTLTGENDLAVGIVACLQTHGSRANWHPHLHQLVTDGGFRRDGTFVTSPAHDTARVTEAFRRAVLRLFVRLELFAEDDRSLAIRLARYGARNPVALEHLSYDRTARTVTYRSDKATGPTAGTESVDPLAFLARVLAHIPDKGQVPTRYYGWYANRPRGGRRRAALLRQIFEVDPLRCTRCQGAMRIGAVITQRSVIDQILAHLRTRTAARSPPSARAPAPWGPPRRPTGAASHAP